MAMVMRQVMASPAGTASQIPFMPKIIGMIQNASPRKMKPCIIVMSMAMLLRSMLWKCVMAMMLIAQGINPKA